jgi:hypothetical protein
VCEEIEMQRKTRVLAAATVLAASAVLVPAAVAAAGPDHATGDEEHGRDDDVTLRFDVAFSPFDIVDVGEPGFSAGDVIVFHDTLLRDGQEVGDQVGSCVLVEATPLANCTGVVRLGDQDTITFAFVNAPPPEKTFALTGGSGRYRTAQGDGTLVENGDGTGTLTLSVVRD